MISRRSIFGLFAALPFVGIAKANPSLIRNGWDDPLPENPKARLIRLKWRFLHQFKNEWELRQDGYCYSGTGWEGHIPNEHCHDYTYAEVKGFGYSANEAIDDWYQHLPKTKGYMILWRTKPEIISQLNFATKETEWCVYSRFAILPFI